MSCTEFKECKRANVFSLFCLPIGLREFVVKTKRKEYDSGYLAVSSVKALNKYLTGLMLLETNAVF